MDLGNSPRYEMPISVVQAMRKPATTEETIIAVPHTIEVPACSVMLITAKVKGVTGLEGLVEPLHTSRTAGIPKNILIARALAQTSVNQSIVLEVTNISPIPTKIYKCTRVGHFIPMSDVFVVNSVQDEKQKPDVAGTLPEV